jgi:para-nitrobenzyl esterase
MHSQSIRNVMKRTAVALGVSTLLVAGVWAHDHDEDDYIAALDMVQVTGGTIVASYGSDPNMRIFKGIPFAAPPVDALRWAPPAPVVPWQGWRRSDGFGPACWQGNRPAKQPNAIIYNETTGQSEDCLYLNVWTSVRAGSNAKRPVMMLIYGGGNQIGTGANSNYNGEGLAQQGPVVVTMNYRLGPLGFLAHPALSAESPNHVSGNYAVLDAIAALQWIKANIAQFGGDPNNVTVYSQSAGAGIASVLLGSPLAKGLFHKMVLESLGFLPAGNPSTTLTQGEAAGSNFATNLGASTIADLRKLPPQDIMTGTGSIIGELVDGYVLPNQLDQLFMVGQINDVPLVAGFNSDEGTPYPPFATTLAGYNTAAQAQFGSFAPAFMKAYPVTSDADVLAMAYEPMRDGSLGWQPFSMARAHAALRRSQTFVYFFNRHPPYFPSQHFVEQDPPSKYGAYHTLEQPYFYNNLDRSGPPRPYTKVDRQISAIGSAYLVNFATRGDPNGRGLPNWPAFVNNSSQLMYIGDVIRPGPHPYPAQLGFYDSFYGSKRRLPF